MGTQSPNHADRLADVKNLTILRYSTATKETLLSHLKTSVYLRGVPAVLRRTYTVAERISRHTPDDSESANVKQSAHNG